MEERNPVRKPVEVGSLSRPETNSEFTPENG